MLEYIVRRVFDTIPVLILVSMISFALLYILPGDPVVAMLGEHEVTDQARMTEMRRELGLLDPLPIRYLKWLTGVMRGDFGVSIRSKQPVAEIISRRLPVSLTVGIAGLLVGIAVGLPAGIVSALRPGKSLDSLVTVLALAGVSIPGFWFGIVIMYFFSVQLGWLPPSGYTRLVVNPVLHIKMLIMPALSIGVRVAAIIMRQIRGGMLDVLQQDYIVTARTKGLRERLVIFRHALKNAMTSVVTVIGLQIGTIVGGVAITESVFAIPGLGRLAVDSITSRDYQLLQGSMLVLTACAIVGNLLADVAYGYLDPRVRYERG
jgi:peptide/nickel transport system permease protein